MRVGLSTLSVGRLKLVGSPSHSYPPRIYLLQPAFCLSTATCSDCSTGSSEMLYIAEGLASAGAGLLSGVIWEPSEAGCSSCLRDQNYSW